MKKLSKLLVLLLALLMVFALAACSGDEDDGEKNDGPTEPQLNQGSADCTHVWADWEEQSESTCTKKGTELRSCTLCGKEESRRIPAAGHYFNEGVCAACGRQERACEHQTVEYVVIKEPTCTEPGQKNAICTICDAVIGTNNIYPTGHSQLTTVVEKEATCTENGRAKDVCGVCGEVEDTYTIYANGHTDTEWVTITEPTCTEYGHKQKVCHICEQIVDESYPSYYGHSYDYTDAKAPTCTEDGWYEYRVCSVCSETNFEEKFRPATGHDNVAGLCTTCGATDAGFVKTDIADIPKLEHTISKPVDAVFTAPAAVIQQKIFNIADDQTDTFQFTAAQTGKYLFWISELYQGNSVKVYVRDYLGQNVANGTNMTNDNSFTANLVKDQVYTVEVATRYCSVPGSYYLNIGCQTATHDVSANTAVSDAIVYKNQVNNYFFTPAVDGTYTFKFTEMVSGMNVDIYVYNDLNAVVDYETYCTNNEGFTISKLAAGKQYKISVIYRSDFGSYVLKIGKQQATVDVSEYNTIHDNLYYGGQKNYYTFTVPADGNYRFQIANIENGGEVNLRLYNSLGEQVAYTTYCGNGEGFTRTNLVAGETYTIAVEYLGGVLSYTLHIFGQKPVVVLTDNTGAADSFEYGEQSNYYTFTATEGGTYRIAITGMNANVDVSLYIYDANGSLVRSNEWCSNGEYLTLSDLVPGATYTIRVYADGTLTDYIISVQ